MKMRKLLSEAKKTLIELCREYKYTVKNNEKVNVDEEFQGYEEYHEALCFIQKIDNFLKGDNENVKERRYKEGSETEQS